MEWTLVFIRTRRKLIEDKYSVWPSRREEKSLLMVEVDECEKLWQAAWYARMTYDDYWLQEKLQLIHRTVGSEAYYKGWLPTPGVSRDD